ncbi:hypothetical protein L6164_016565 [Bauhinia variegata]|uniref:Uncharacterized protein n=1 Tax=Bauhinia variegata TaxID=167791 RepID=A0ACB9NTJ4_BAUVA|nr:hypothetical protein L6164_016565 [Bauhinia variegata]
MDAASQLVYCGIDPLRRCSLCQSSFARNKLRVRKPVNRVFAVPAGPKFPRISSSPSENGVIGSSRSPPAKPVNGVSMKMGDVSQEIKRRDSLFAEDNVPLRLVEVEESSECLPLVCEPASISAYWGKRPCAVATRIVQLLSIAGGFLSRLAMDVINKKVKENEVARAIELREIVTSLGPAYIKLGQALSIRPDILSPVAMTELQKLCDKVPSFPDDIAMDLIEEKLGQPWLNIYSELSTSLIPVASLGQVYKGRLKENGYVVAVKVQRPFVLEKVTIDLCIIRNLGMVLRKFPQVSIDVVGLVDEWTARFFEELDYVSEGRNGALFAEMMRKDLPQGKMGDVSQEIKRVREQMEENEQLATLMRGLRESSECLPLVYEPASISAYWGKRPRAVVTRIIQLLSIAGGFLSRLAMDVINNKVKKNEVARAIELREISFRSFAIRCQL